MPEIIKDMSMEQVLEAAPGKIAYKKVEYEKARYEYLKEKEGVKNSEAKAYLVIKATHEKATASEVNARVDSNEDVYKDRMELLKKEALMRKKQVEIESWVDAFTSARKLVSLQIAEMQNIDYGQKGEGK